VEGEKALQQKLDRVYEELHEAQRGSTILQTQVDASKEQTKALTGQYTQTHLVSLIMHSLGSVYKWKKVS